MGRFGALIAAFAVSGMLCAAPVGNPSAPKILQEGLFISSDKWIDLRSGYEGDFVQDGRMEQCNQSHSRVDLYEQWTQSGTITFNILDRIDFYGVLGSSRTKTDWRFGNLSAGTVSRIEIKTETNFLWGAGSRLIAYEWTNLCAGFGGRYSFCMYKPDWIKTDGKLVRNGESFIRWREWQLNLDISYKIVLFTPYIGLKYSNAKSNLKNFKTPISSNLTGSTSFKNRIPVGIYVGCTLSNGNYFMLNVEGRVIDEEAVAVSGEFRF